MTKALDTDLLAAHARNDKSALVDLYQAAANAAKTADARAFFLTHAYIFALEINHSQRFELKQSLVDLGRETGV